MARKAEDGKSMFHSAESGVPWHRIAADHGCSETTARKYAAAWYDKLSTADERAEIREIRRYRAGQKAGTPQAEQKRQADMFFAGQPCLGADCWGCPTCGTPDLDF